MVFFLMSEFGYQLTKSFLNFILVCFFERHISPLVSCMI